ncbi:hypothetical protein, partial [Enterococcus faecium]|uniref:hypothetical protein n=1 Tax=Enterococcus faecium TaxID=1352 RepID=UPI001E522271
MVSFEAASFLSPPLLFTATMKKAKNIQPIILKIDTFPFFFFLKSLSKKLLYSWFFLVFLVFLLFILK